MIQSEDMAAHMHRVQQVERDLRELSTVWRTIESAAAISCPEEVAPILPTLIGTRERFESLQGRLIEEMIVESKAALGDELASKAQCAIDILVRNLFERTADVGFLATDDVVRQFCALDADAQAQQRSAMVARLREYQSKYTVYDDVVLLAADGRVLARLDERNDLPLTCDSIVAQALSARGYVERYAPTDLQHMGASALLYAQRIESTQNHALGVLVLRFRFDDEMAHIFAGVADARQEMAIVLIGDDQRVVATVDAAHVPVGARLAKISQDEVSLTAFGGREYLAVCCASRGYQGYAGPGWRAQAMVSLLTAFRHRHDVGRDAQADNMTLDHEPLQLINRDAEEINRELRRVVWNGRLMASIAHTDRMRLKAVLEQVNVASVRTRQRVNLAIQDLALTALARSHRQASDLARLATDIMDRNLYERANDCRWWALSPAVQRILAELPSASNSKSLNATLDAINDLYTVYSRLLVFDERGTIRGASRLQGRPQPGILGSAIDASWLDALRLLNGSQQYTVSEFADTLLHDEGRTYTYLAAIRDPAGRFLGGIAIVFNAAREFKAMLSDVMGTRPGFAAFIDSDGRMIATTDEAQTDAGPVQFKGDTATVEHHGIHYVYAQAAAAGYREFKTSDGYQNHVRAVVGLRLGASERRRTVFADAQLSSVSNTHTDPLEFAIFQVGPMRFGILTSAVIESISQQGLVATPGRTGATLGMMKVNSTRPPRMIPVVCGRQLFGVTGPARASDGVVLVLRDPDQSDRPALGLRVDDVSSVLEIDQAQRHPAPAGAGSYAPFIQGLLDARASTGTQDQTVLIQWVDVRQLIRPGSAADSETSEDQVA